MQRNSSLISPFDCGHTFNACNFELNKQAQLDFTLLDIAEKDGRFNWFANNYFLVNRYLYMMASTFIVRFKEITAFTNLHSEHVSLNKVLVN